MEPLEVNLDEVLQRLDRPDYAAVRQSLRNVDFNSAFDMLATYIGSAADLKPWVQGAQINTDGNLRLSYLAGWGINSEVADNLYHLILAYRHLPVTIFSGSTDHLRTFLAELQSPSVAHKHGEWRGHLQRNAERKQRNGDQRLAKAECRANQCGDKHDQ